MWLNQHIWVDSCHRFTNILQGFFTGTGWSWISQVTLKHMSKIYYYHQNKTQRTMIETHFTYTGQLWSQPGWVISSIIKCKMKLLIHSKNFSGATCWSLGMGKWFYSTLYWLYIYDRIKLIHFIKREPCCHSCHSWITTNLEDHNGYPPLCLAMFIIFSSYHDAQGCNRNVALTSIRLSRVLFLTCKC